MICFVPLPISFNLPSFLSHHLFYSIFLEEEREGGERESMSSLSMWILGIRETEQSFAVVCIEQLAFYASKDVCKKRVVRGFEK